VRQVTTFSCAANFFAISLRSCPIDGKMPALWPKPKPMSVARELAILSITFNPAIGWAGFAGRCQSGHSSLSGNPRIAFFHLSELEGGKRKGKRASGGR
jgi:hypothetical protein